MLLIHGDADSIVPLSYSERALEVYPSAELKVIEVQLGKEISVHDKHKYELEQ